MWKKQTTISKMHGHKKQKSKWDKKKTSWKENGGFDEERDYLGKSRKKKHRNQACHDDSDEYEWLDDEEYVDER